MIRSLIAIAAAAFLGACATSPPPYQAAAAPGAVGYSETRVENNRYFITYNAPNAADAALLQDYALLRAADLTLQNGREWFWVDRRTIDENATRNSGPSVGVGIGGGSWGGRSGGSVGVGVNFPLGGQRGQRARSATLEIRFGDGAKPNEPNAYDAREIATNLRARIVPAG